MNHFFFLFGLNLVFSHFFLAINCGGDEYIDSKGNLWFKDKDYEGGQTTFLNDNRYIRFTNDPYIYMSERQSSDDFFYYLPLFDSGSYVIVLKNSEYFNAKGKKITNFFIGATAVHGNMDIFEGFKDSAAIDEFIQVTVNKTGLFWSGKKLIGAVKNGKIIFKFARNSSELARIAGIFVFKGEIQESGFGEYVEKVKRFRRLARNKSEMAERPLQFPKDHQVLTSASLYSVVWKYPFSIIFAAIAFYLVLSKVIDS